MVIDIFNSLGYLLVFLTWVVNILLLHRVRLIKRYEIFSAILPRVYLAACYTYVMFGNPELELSRLLTRLGVTVLLTSEVMIHVIYFYHRATKKQWRCREDEYGN